MLQTLHVLEIPPACGRPSPCPSQRPRLHLMHAGLWPRGLLRASEPPHLGRANCRRGLALAQPGRGPRRCIGVRRWSNGNRRSLTASASP